MLPETTYFLHSHRTISRQPYSGFYDLNPHSKLSRNPGRTLKTPCSSFSGPGPAVMNYKLPKLGPQVYDFRLRVWALGLRA